MNKWLKISMALTGITLTGAGAFYLYANYKSLDDLDFSIEDVKFKGSSDTLTIKVSIKLKNPTDFNLKVYGYSFDLDLEGTYIGTAKSEDVTEVRKKLLLLRLRMTKRDPGVRGPAGDHFKKVR